METVKKYEVEKKADPVLSAEDVKKYIAPNATDKELFLFMNIAKSYGLNPFKREIHFVKYGQSPASIIVGYETYIKRADATGKLDGWRAWIEDKGKPDERAIIQIKRKDFSDPFIWEVYRHEFDTKQANWNRMPAFMLKKVAIAQGFRLAFPSELGGLPYTKEELSVEDAPMKDAMPKAKMDPAPQITEEVPEPEDVPEPEQMKDDGEKIKKLKKELSDMMVAFHPDEKRKFFNFITEKNVTVDKLEFFINNFNECRLRYMAAQVQKK